MKDEAISTNIVRKLPLWTSICLSVEFAFYKAFCGKKIWQFPWSCESHEYEAVLNESRGTSLRLRHRKAVMGDGWYHSWWCTETRFCRRYFGSRLPSIGCVLELSIFLSPEGNIRYLDIAAERVRHAQVKIYEGAPVWSRIYDSWSVEKWVCPGIISWRSILKLNLFDYIMRRLLQTITSAMWHLLNLKP